MELRSAVLPLLLLACSACCAACGPDASAPPNTPGPSSTSSGTPSAAPSAETDAGTPPSSAGTKTLFVSEKKSDCVGAEGPRKCLQTRSKESDPWENFYSRIEGFTYEEGTKYQLEITTEPRPNPPQDASSIRYKLVKIVSQEKVTK